ncbi:MAG: AMP-dependent synthetase/ligase [Anaerovoracaceae bacterium]
MNSKRYRDKRYSFRQITDIKDLIYSSAALYSDWNAFLVKDIPGGIYRPIKFYQLKEDIDGLGTAFMNLGLNGKKVAIIGENRYEWALAYFAVTCGMGVVVPLEKELKPSEIYELLECVNVSAVVYSDKMEKIVEDATKGLKNLEYLINMDTTSHEGNKLSLNTLIKEGKELVKSGDHNFIDKEIDPEVMSLLLFTSGTTGVSKGVMLSQKNIVANVMNMSMFVNVKGWVSLSVLPMHHTYEMTCNVLTSMYQGCCIAICEGLKHIPKNMEEAKVNVMLGVPLLFETMYRRIWKQAEKSGKTKILKQSINLSKKLRLYKTGLVKIMFKEIHNALGGHMNLLISGAAAIDPNVVEDFCAMGLPMIQGYGMTENAPIIAVNMDRYSKAASVGLPMPNTQIKIIEPDQDGVGEIICKSDSVMLGYYNNPEQTEQTLRDGWLYTGDYGYFDEDGFLYITGRKKNVIVTKNGKNIFPEEVEFYILKNTYILECVVYGVEEEPGGETIVCAEIYPDYDAIEEDFGKKSETEIKKILKRFVDEANDNIPMYKRVKRFCLRETEFEKNASKKIKRYLVEKKLT